MRKLSRQHTSRNACASEAHHGGSSLQKLIFKEILEKEGISIPGGIPLRDPEGSPRG